MSRWRDEFLRDFAEMVPKLEKKLKTTAPKRCKKLHPCAKCPSECSGCKLLNPTGRISDERPRKQPKKKADGSWQCTVKTEVAFRCRCSPCKKKKKKK